MSQIHKLFILCFLSMFSIGAAAQADKVVVIPLGDGVSLVGEATEATYYSRTNLTSPEWNSQPLGSDHIRACVMVLGTSAQVRFQSIYTIAPSIVDESDVLLAGTLTNDSGTLTPSANSCSGKDSYEATITDVTPVSLTLNLIGNRTVSTILPVTDIWDACVGFIPDAILCNTP